MDIVTLALAKKFTKDSVGGLWDKWNTTTAYATGQIVLYNGIPYQKKSGTSTVGTFVPSEWEQINISDELEKIALKQDKADAVSVVKLTDGTETLSQLKDRLDALNLEGKHIFFDTSSLNADMYLCTIFIDGTSKYRVTDCVTGKTAIGSYNASKTLATILSEAVADLVTITVTCNTQDGVTVTGQTVTLRNGTSATAPVIATASYNGQPVTFTVAKDFVYYVSVTDTLSGHANPSTATGIATTNTSVILTYLTATVYAFHVNGQKTSPSEMITYPSGCDNENFAPAYMNYTTGEFNYGGWENAFFMPRPCMLKYDGTVDYYLDPNDYTKKEDGVTASDVADSSYGGNAMMEWGQNGNKIYYKVVPDSGSTSSATIYISNIKVDEGYKNYSFINNQGVEVPHFYTPIYNGSLINSTIRSLSGQTCMVSQSGTNEIAYAKNNNATSDVLWNTEVLADAILINFLLMLIGKSTDTQATFGNGHYTGGSSASSLLQTGTMNTNGLFYGTNGTGSGVKVFGMENWWGNQWRRYAGHINASGTQKIKLTYGTQDGSTASAYNTDGTGYIEISATPSGSSGGYVSEMLFTSEGMFSKVASGSSSTYYCDGLWFNNNQTDYAFRGGCCSFSLFVGAFFCYLYYPVSFETWDIGASLSCKPLAIGG